ncbi:hypothetical protein [Bradyrhizobium acaciae]|uniref:hypothetical protein n=1 Tax=Bradyrhizobium acaciae TaxID=2683706 RepID=UPI001E3F3E18|nr:hypothetical protein [Bradyrhizobium acaciae]MCC8981149.1 hypothetical protein [Bradyrhizobium acaciae]
MIDIRSPLEIAPEPHGGRQLVFWTGQAFEYTTLFRNLLDAEALGQDAQRYLQQPAYEHLTGAPALLLFALIVAYFYLGWKVLGGTLWQHILGAR